MEDITAPLPTEFSIVDLSPFKEGGDESCQKKVIDTISKACSDFGVFLVQIDDESIDQCTKLLTLSNIFFGYTEEEKKEYTKKAKEHSGAGYGKFVDDKYHDCEYLLLQPSVREDHGVLKPNDYNGVPTTPNDYGETFEAVFNYLEKTSKTLEEIFTKCIGLPPHTLKNYNNNRNSDFMIPMYYTKSTETYQTYDIRDDIEDDIAIVDHQDPGLITLVLQDDVSGLEFKKDGIWIPLIPEHDKMVVIVGDLIQVLGNKKVRHLKHRALKNKESERLAIDFCYNFTHDKWREPLHVLMGEIGVKPNYRGFAYKEYADLVANDYKHPPKRVEDFTDIKRYEI